MLRAVCHSEASRWTEVRDLERISDLLGVDGNLLWIEADIAHIGVEDRDTIAEELGLHALAMEDAVNLRQRPKVDSYEGHLFVVFHQLDDRDGQLEAAQVACFIGDRYVLTLHGGAERTLRAAERRWRAEESPSELEAGPGFLLYTLLDTVVDDYQRISDHLEDEVEELEDIALATPLAPLQHQLYTIKQRLARLRRFALPVGRVVSSVAAPDTDPHFTRPAIERLNDVADNVMRIRDQVESTESLSQAVLDLTRSEQAHALNDVTKKLTAWAAIIAVPTFITSLYGMNFALVPEENQLFGFFFALGLILFSGLYLYRSFRGRGWI
ncbi:magnesium transporter CorA family protein [soil metagenome]